MKLLETEQKWKNSVVKIFIEDKGKKKKPEKKSPYNNGQDI